MTAANFIFCDYPEVSGEIWNVANQIKNAKLAAMLVVDSCPWEEAKRLNQLARAEDSALRVITLGADGYDQVEDCLMIRPLKADRDTIRGILAQAIEARADEIDFVAAQCDGFPRIAVLAAKALGSAASIRKSTNEVAEQILNAAGVGEETVRALHFALIRTSLDDLAALDISQELLEALRLLAARSSTFRPTASLMLRLTAVTDYADSSPVVQLLRQLYQVALAGTGGGAKRNLR